MGKKRRKMAIQLFIITFAVIAVMIGALLIIQSVYFEQFYLSWKTNKLQIQMDTFVKNVSETELGYTDYIKLKQNFAVNNNAGVYTLLETGVNLEQQLYKNQKWMGITIEYEDGIHKKIILSELDIYTYLRGKDINIGQTYYIVSENINAQYQYCYELTDSETYELINEASVIQLSDGAYIEVPDRQEIEVVSIKEATPSEQSKYSGASLYAEVTSVAANNATLWEMMLFSNNADQQINLKKEAAGPDGQKMRFYLSASLQPVDEASAAITSYYPWFFLVAVITALIVAFVYARRVSGPIGRISKAAEMMSEGNLDTRIKSKSKNEIGVLADSLNVLSQNLSNTLGELKTANEKLLEDIAQKEHEEKVRREFTANVSHDLKTPLGVMRCYAELLRDNIEPDKNSEFIEILLLEIDKMNKLVMQMLQLAKTESGDAILEKSTFNIKNMMEETAEMFGPILKEKNIDVRIRGDFKDIVADSKKMEQVIVNLIANASEYAHEDSVLELKGEIANGKCRISIKNKCDPITQEQAGQVFKRFYTLDKARNANGTGLGLAICAAIFDLHGFKYGAAGEEGYFIIWFEYDC